MIDVARQRGVTIDTPRLSRQLGIPVIELVANRRRGVRELKGALASAQSQSTLKRDSPFPQPFQQEVEALCGRLNGCRNDALAGATPASENRPIPRYLVERLLLDTTGYLEDVVLPHNAPEVHDAIGAARARLATAGCQVPAIEAVARYGWVGETLAGVINRPTQRPVTFGDRLDRLLTHRLWGTVAFLLLMVLVFQAVFSWASYPQDLIDAGIAAVASMVESHMASGRSAQLARRWIDWRRRRCDRFLAADIHLVLFYRGVGRLRLHGPGRISDGQVDGRVGLSGKSFIPLFLHSPAPYRA